MARISMRSSARADPEKTLVHHRLEDLHHAPKPWPMRASARAWLAAKLGEAAVDRHFVAVSTNIAAVQAFGIDPKRMFRFWDWVGGRYSLWSAIGLSIILAVGPREVPRSAGGCRRHGPAFPEARRWPKTCRCILGLLQVWHRNFCGHATQAILPYAQDLWRLPAYLQQLEMESNGKRVTRDGAAVTWRHLAGDLGPGRHQRPACLPPDAASGIGSGAVRLHPGGARSLRLSRTSITCWWPTAWRNRRPLPSANLAAAVAKRNAGCRPRCRGGCQTDTASHLSRQSAIDHHPAAGARMPIISVRWWRFTSTRCLSRPPSGASIRSINGALSLARRWQMPCWPAKVAQPIPRQKG